MNLNVVKIVMQSLAVVALIVSCGVDPDSERFGVRFGDNTGDAQKNGEGAVPGEPPEGEEPVNNDPPPAGPEGTGMDVQEIETILALRNFEQANQTMAALTGVPVTTAAVVTEYNALKSQLPTNNSIKELNPARVSAYTKLAARYCDEMSRNAALSGAVVPGVNFATPPATALAQPQTIARALLERFWGTNLENLPDMTANVQTVAALIGEMAAGKAATAATSQAVLMGACTAVLASGPVLTF
jgi:hypothetical protein